VFAADANARVTQEFGAFISISSVLLTQNGTFKKNGR
jgi:hypothetical protein